MMLRGRFYDDRAADLASNQPLGEGQGAELMSETVSTPTCRQSVRSGVLLRLYELSATHQSVAPLHNAHALPCALNSRSKAVATSNNRRIYMSRSSYNIVCLFLTNAYIRIHMYTFSLSALSLPSPLQKRVIYCALHKCSICLDPGVISLPVDSHWSNVRFPSCACGRTLLLFYVYIVNGKSGIV